jgi:GWxTD domain-containing protein
MKRSKKINLIGFAPLLALLCIPARDLHTAESLITPATQFAFNPKETVSDSSDSLAQANRYLALLDETDDSTFQIDFESDFLLILNRKQKDYYIGLPALLDKKEFIKQYWSAYNPNPLLPQNDRLLNHVVRVKYARETFSIPVPPYIDDRGKYYIMYGEPALRYTDPGGIRRIALFSPGAYEWISNRYYNFKNGPDQKYSVPPNESWSYENVAPDFVVHFVLRGRQYEEVQSLSEILPTRRRAHMAWQWSDLIKHRASISPLLSRAAADIELFESELLMASDVDIATGNRITKGSAHTKMIKTLEKGDEDLFRAKQHLPPTSYKPIDAKNKLIFYFDTAQFRGKEGRTRIDVDFFVPLKKNFVIELDSLVTDTLQLEMSAMLRDRYFRPVARQDAFRVTYTQLSARYNYPFIVERLTFDVLPQKSELAVQVKNRKSDDIGFAKSAYPIVDFSGKDLMLSDLQFYTEITNDEQKSILPVFEIQGIPLLPYPEPTLRKSGPLLCYFEIYNLRSSGITGAFEVSYKVATSTEGQGLFKKFSRLLSKSKESAISLSLSRPVDEDTAQELIAIDLSSLETGRYILEITVADTKNPERKAIVQRVIEVVE